MAKKKLPAVKGRLIWSLIVGFVASCVLRIHDAIRGPLDAKISECIKVTITCRDCGKEASFFLRPGDAYDWGWMMLGKVEKCGFEISESFAYCKSCSGKYQRGAFNMLMDKEGDNG